MTIDLLEFEIYLGKTPASQTEVLEAGGVTTVYSKYDVKMVGDKEPIVKTVVQADGSSTQEKAFDTWANRATATYTTIRRGR